MHAKPFHGRRSPLPLLVAGWLLSWPGALAAVQEETAPRRETAPPVFRETAEVNVVNVEVAVSDRQGRPVTGLEREDFELFENGRPVEISNFFAVQGGRQAPRLVTTGSDEAAPPIPDGPRIRQNHLIIYVDNANIRETNRRKVFNSLREFLRSNWRSNLWAMVVSNDRSLTIRQEFTPDLETVLEAVDELAQKASAQPRFDAERRNLMRLIEDVNVEAGSGVFGIADPNAALIQGQAQALLPLIRSYSEERLQYIRETLRILDQFVSMAAGMPGRKSVLYVSDGLSLRPGEALYEGFARRFQLLGSVGANTSPDLEASRDDATADFRDLVTRANTSGVTFYTIDASPTAALVRGSAETVGSAGGNFGSWRDAIETTEQSVRQDSLVMMADGTGGRYGFTPASFDDLFDGIFTDFDNFYSLGYLADRLESGKKRDIEVRLRDNPGGLEVRFRRSFRDKTALELAAERAQAALLVDDLDNPLGVTLEPRDRTPFEGNYVVHMLVKLDIATLALLPEEEALRGNVSLFVAVRDDQGRASAVRRILCPIQIPAVAGGADADGTAACGARLLMRDGRQRVAVSVLDETAKVHSTTSTLVDVGALDLAPAQPATG
jgi:VWFA-related protein